MTHRLPTYFLSHGGGPWPWLKDWRPGVYDALERSLQHVRKELGELPRAVLMITTPSWHFASAGPLSKPAI